MRSVQPRTCSLAIPAAPPVTGTNNQLDTRASGPLTRGSRKVAARTDCLGARAVSVPDSFVDRQGPAGGQGRREGSYRSALKRSSCQEAAMPGRTRSAVPCKPPHTVSRAACHPQCCPAPQPARVSRSTHSTSTEQ